MIEGGQLDVGLLNSERAKALVPLPPNFATLGGYDTGGLAKEGWSELLYATSPNTPMYVEADSIHIFSVQL